MMEDNTTRKVISKNNSGFPGYLNFEKLRKEGIEYLGELAGKIWTDHNVHDPGISILEMLCYAMLDLGYRTNLPASDIFTSDPECNEQDNNFFTPSQILTCNPLTITDFRKLLIDIGQVKNAWLEVATEVEDICRNRRHHIDENEEEGISGAIFKEYLNGLYHVYIDLEDEFDVNDQICLKQKVDEIRDCLMSHRNFCEDFIDIHILCKQEIGICADIELEKNADAESIFIEINEKLRDFVNPSPRFYTLQELLDKNKSIEEIFAGRPYNIQESHGFIDTGELEKIELKKEIHLSDIYNVLFEIPGVRNVKKLAFKNCNNQTGIQTDPKTFWNFKVMEDHVAEYSPDCSVIRLFKNNIHLPFDVKKYRELLELNFNHSGKVLYKMPSPYLDHLIPRGIYREGLDAYYSIQNEFPRVYGIEEGGLPDNVTPLRKAQALQLKGYLLFFDQLLANYLTQLRNVRSLFAFSTADQSEKQHTYFINNLNSVPELNKLLRFDINNNSVNNLGSEGSILVFPVDKKRVLSQKNKDQLKYLSPEDFKFWSFNTIAEKNITVSQFKNDLFNETYSCEYVAGEDNSFYYYILSNAKNIALMSKKTFSSKYEAAQHAASVQYIGTFEENYRSFHQGNNLFSFDIELNLDSYNKYLQLLIEDRNLFLQRRKGFLNHLMARFSERFTDYALLSFDSVNKQQSKESEIKVAEKFLSGYDEISANRGKGYNYRTGGWNVDNVSGFEKRVKALSGIENWKRHYLCNFIVEQVNQQYYIKSTYGGVEFFTGNEKFNYYNEAADAAASLSDQLSDLTAYYVEHISENNYAIKIKLALGYSASFYKEYETQDEAYGVINNLYRMFSHRLLNSDVFVSDFIYRIQLQDSDGKVVSTQVKYFKSESVARDHFEESAKHINDKKEKWNGEGTIPRSLSYDTYHKDLFQFIDPDAFKVNVVENEEGKGKYGYLLSDAEDHINVKPTIQFDNADEARKHSLHLLLWMLDESNYEVVKNDTGNFIVQINFRGRTEGICNTKADDYGKAVTAKDEIIGIIQKYKYKLAVAKEDHLWKFRFELGYDEPHVYKFISTESYNSRQEAFAAGSIFYSSISSVDYHVEDNKLFLKSYEVKNVSLEFHPDNKNENDILRFRGELEKILNIQKDIFSLRNSPDKSDFKNSVFSDESGSAGFVYRLVDNDNVVAFMNTIDDRKDLANVRKNKLSSIRCKEYDYLEICYGGDDIINSVADKNGVLWYNYLIKCRNKFDSSGNRLVLFESIQVFQSYDEAMIAFTENYLKILELASNTTEYGLSISLNPVNTHSNVPYGSYIVFVPENTIKELSEGQGESLVDTLIKIVQSYPIRHVEYGSLDFYDLSGCNPQIEIPGLKKCTQDQKIYVYYFRLYLPGSSDELWQSTKFYLNPDDARKEFDFFLMLLCYPGNFYVDCFERCEKDGEKDNEGNSIYKIYLREVLAESTERFNKEELVWTEGVDKFICIAQSQKAFHTYQKRDNCCYSFYVACEQESLYHPCQYDTPERRSEVMTHLFKEYSKVHGYNLLRMKSGKSDSEILLLNPDGDVFALIAGDEKLEGCCYIFEIFKYIFQDKIKIERDRNGTLVIGIPSEKIKIKSVGKFETDQWLEMLKIFACYFPVVRRVNEDTKNHEYTIEIKFPDFNDCDFQPVDYCGEKEEVVSDCFIAWKSNCTYNSCENALTDLFSLSFLLSDFQNYQPSFDCEGNSYGIDLVNRQKSENQNRFSTDKGKIVAFNPQCYKSSQIVCEATERSMKLINSEGLHVVEHILLRPEPDGDCECLFCIGGQRDCKQSCCCFKWNVENDDPCAEDKQICFVPGRDPYSFIATVVLPGWPSKFRNSEGRKIMENILYLEAPAHVLLRILWLTPHDLCEFESLYKNWGKHLAGKKNCMEEYRNCGFIEFLFCKSFECMKPCDVCKCGDETPVNVSCSDVPEDLRSDPDFYLNQINSLYCWTSQDCNSL